MNNKVCMIVVTYNRKSLLLRNLSAALAQNHPLDILVFDNHSSDGTFEYLYEKGVLPADNITYYRSDENLGGAGGFSAGLKKAYDMGYQYFWLMDDDGYCYDNNTLINLISRIPEETDTFIINSTVICNDCKKLTFGFLDIQTYEDLTSQSVNGVYDGYINPFNGTLISRGCIDRIGFPIGEFFLYGDEHEYMLRAQKNEVIVRTVVDSLYFHPVNRPITYRKIGRYTIPLKDEPVWKSFCDVRNSCYISKNYESRKMQIYRVLTYLITALNKPRKKGTYFYYTLLGIKDGLKGDLSRKPMFDK